MKLNLSWKQISYLLIIDFIGLTDLLILFDIPILRQIFGFCLLLFIPGLLIIRNLKIDNISKLNSFLFIIGLSVSFIMLYGLFINSLCLFFNYYYPLATMPFLFFLHLALLLLMVNGYRISNRPLISKLDIKITAFEKNILSLCAIFPFFSITGIILMNILNNNLIIILFLFCIAFFILLIAIIKEEITENITPFILYSISISLILLISLRFDHLIGADIHYEYYFYKLTFDNHYWTIVQNDLISICVSATLLPTVYNSIINLPDEVLFKVLYPLIYSFSPLIVYSLVKRYVGDLYGFLAGIFFIFQFSFLWTSANARTSIAVIFFGLSILALYGTSMKNAYKQFLLIIFIISLIISHYTTSYIFLIYLLILYLTLMVTKLKSNNLINGKLVALFFLFIIFWYSIISSIAFSSGIKFVTNIFSSQYQFFIQESRSSSAQTLLGGDIMMINHAQLIELFLTYAIFAFIGIGVLFFIQHYYKNRNFNLSGILSKIGGEEINAEFFILIITSVIILLLVLILPHVSIGYDVQRVYTVTTFFLSLCFIVGGILVTKYLNKIFKMLLNKKNLHRKMILPPYGSIVVILLLYFFCLNGVIYQFDGDSRSLILNSNGVESYSFRVFDQDTSGAIWMTEYYDQRLFVETDFLGRLIFVSQAENVHLPIFEENNYSNYTFIRRGETIRNGNTTYSRIFSSNLLFSNDGSFIIYSN